MLFTSDSDREQKSTFLIKPNPLKLNLKKGTQNLLGVSLSLTVRFPGI